MINKIKKDNPQFDLIDRYEWLGNIQHNISDFNLHLEGLNKRFDQQLYKQTITTSMIFDHTILEKYKSCYLKSIPFVLSQGLAHNFIFQISHQLIVCFMLGKIKDERLILIPDYHSTCLNLPYNFIIDNLEYVVDEEKKSLGFGGV